VGRKQRVEDLERKAGVKEAPVVIVVWRNPDGTVTVNDETMTGDEFKARFPHGPNVLTVEWGDWP